MEFKLLGPVEVVHEGRPLPLGGSKPRTLLAVLLLAEGRTVTETRLSRMLWDSRPPRTRRAQLHTYASRLRKLLDPYADVVHTGSGYALGTRHGTLDLTDFRRRVELGHDEARRGRPAQASARLADALAMWRGPALGGTTDFLVEAERSRLEDARLAALEERVGADLAQGRHGHLLVELGGLVEEHPLRERLRAQLMTALYRCGRQADALEVHQRGRDRLAAAGVRPGPVLDRVFHAILDADPALDVPSPAAPPAAPGARRRAEGPSLLPPDVADFTGREGCLDLLGVRLRSSAPGPVVISGAVGVGKSALAVRLAHRCADRFPDGRLYVDLGGMPPGRERVHRAAGRLIEALEPGRPLPDSAQERAALYRAVVGGGRVLVLLDGAADEAEVRPLLPGPGPARVVVTAHARLAALGDAHRADLRAFTAAEALELFGRTVGVRRIAAEPEAADRVMASCERLPAAVRAAGARLAARPHWTVARLAARLADPSRNRLDELSVADLDLRAGPAGLCRELSARSRQTLTRLAFLRRRLITSGEAAEALGAPERDAEDLLESLADARALDVVSDASGATAYALSEFLSLYLREQCGSGRDVWECLSILSSRAPL
ncbi:BTAD domain-containing putative transcriptional regulator [Streptomyces sp. B21-097]|uniref:BTAD domain-containing putative transcriptional regulator n=2 Tax=Streptomyces TaxID=1883 RepID=UPI002FF166A1